VEMVPSKGEGAVGRRGEEGDVDDSLDARGDGGVHGRDMQGDPVRMLASRDEVERLDALEGGSHRLAVGIVARDHDLGAAQIRRSGVVPRYEPLLDAPLRQATGHTTAELATPPCDGYHGDDVKRAALLHGSRSSRPPSFASPSIPAAAARSRSAARASSSSTTVQ
jgi:hypothetical protein